jgi:maleate cis-trans isomerase
MAAIARNPNLGGVRVGLIIPSVNAIIEPEFARLAPEGFSFHAARVMLRETTPEGLRAMNTEVASAARLVASVNPKVVAYACTSGSFLEGRSGLSKQLTEIGAITQCPVVATSAAMLDAVRALNLKRIALATPYLDVLNRIEKEYFESENIEIVSLAGLGLSGTAIREVPPEEVVRLVRRVDRPEAEGVFVSCTDFRAAETVALLESELKKPVLTSNLVTLWALLRACGQTMRRTDLGRLFAS